MPAPRLPLSGNASGALWMLASVLGATAMTLAVRVLAPEIHTAMLAFLRSALGLVVLPPILWRVRASGAPLRFPAPGLHLLRGGLLGVALNSGFYAIWQLPLATATLLFFLAPVFATAMAVVLRGERVGAARLAAIAAGLGGATIVLRPDVGLDPAMLWAMVSSLAFAATLILGRVLSDRGGTDSVFVSSSLVAVLATLPLALWHWGWPDQAWLWAGLALLVAGSSLRSYADIRAYAVGEAGFLAPFSYLRLVTVGACGYWLFDERIDGATLIGGAIIVAATLALAMGARARV